MACSCFKTATSASQHGRQNPHPTMSMFTSIHPPRKFTAYPIMGRVSIDSEGIVSRDPRLERVSIDSITLFSRDQSFMCLAYLRRVRP